MDSNQPLAAFFMEYGHYHRGDEDHGEGAGDAGRKPEHALQYEIAGQAHRQRGGRARKEGNHEPCAAMPGETLPCGANRTQQVAKEIQPGHQPRVGGGKQVDRKHVRQDGREHEPAYTHADRHCDHARHGSTHGVRGAGRHDQ